MKSKLLIVMLLASFGLSTKGQVTLEQTYLNNGYFKKEITPGFGAGYSHGMHSLYMVHLEFDGDKYVSIDRLNQTMDFYNLNHSLFKTIDFSGVYTGISPSADEDKVNSTFLYITQSLFDVDTAIEFLYTNFSFYNPSQSYKAITHIVKENGTIMFTDSAAPLVKTNFHQQFYPIYNTANGTKMILSNVNGTAEVFSLPGTIAECTTGNNILSTNPGMEMNLFPNPANKHSVLTLDYTLPENVKKAILIIVDENGKQIKTIQIGNAMQNLLLNISEFTAGIYFYTIMTDDGKIIQSKKSIVVD